MDQITRGQGPQQVQASSPTYDSYDDFSQNELIQPRMAPVPPLPPKPTLATSPRSSPPKVHVQAQHRPPPRLVDSPPVGALGTQAPVSNRRDKEMSPIPSQRVAWKAEGKTKGPGTKGKASKYVISFGASYIDVDYDIAVRILRPSFMMCLSRWMRFRRLGRLLSPQLSHWSGRIQSSCLGLRLGRRTGWRML